MLKITSILIFWISLLVISISLWAFTLGQTLPFEFKSAKLESDFHYLIFTSTPIAILFTLFGTLKRRHALIRKLTTALLTIMLSILCFLYLVNNIFSIGFGAWTTFNILYENKQYPKQQILEQRYDAGALGYRGTRVVEVKSFAGLFWKVTPIDTTTIDLLLWKQVNKDGDIKIIP